MSNRYDGQNTSLAWFNTTTKEEQIPDMKWEKCKVSFPFKLADHRFIGQLGPEFREFYDGAEAEVEFQPHVGLDYVSVHNAIKAKSQGKSNDEFSIAFELTSPDDQTIRVILLDVHFEENLPLDLGGQQEFVTSSIKVKCQRYKVAVA